MEHRDASVECFPDDTVVFHLGGRLMGSIRPVGGCFEWRGPLAEALPGPQTSGLVASYQEALRKIGYPIREKI